MSYPVDCFHAEALPAAIVPTTAKALVHCSGRLLLLRKHSGQWDLPGGKCEPGEPIAAALARELREEVGLDAGQAMPLGWGLRGRTTRPAVPVMFYRLDLADAVLAGLRLSSEHSHAVLVGAHDWAGFRMPALYRSTGLHILGVPAALAAVA